jgi:hypothetical protein
MERREPLVIVKTICPLSVVIAAAANDAVEQH